ncbi:uncharacterized protein A1O9_11244 [Exophiala aquamarina CBS 119918]|uniref:PAC domain-containing protein n=1 Tax=Exophiala aquamarina CBS 119918 TaxID=1182545 RepID=A0A072NZI7_9EURO|nr:uncharacterized protein A1O9_11244 [Exophiala aquamarina CBS 119918]KEF52827.1 hypothetical protein A1O9_11244 [Exophiala aquamarina CBS 119918]
MDLERIKQNFRLRSGRSKSKKIRKPVPLQLDSNTHFHTTYDRSIPTTAVQLPERPQTQHNYEPAKDEPSLRNWDDQTALPQFSHVAGGSGPVEKPRPNLPHAATGSYSNSSPNKRLSRFGRSGIERPRKQPSPVEAAQHRPQPLHRALSEADVGAASNSDASDALDFDLRPPPPRPKPPSVESLSEALFSHGHLSALLRHPLYLAQFTTFVGKFCPFYHTAILRYLETQKAIKAVEYANAIAESLDYSAGDDHGEEPAGRPSSAATLEQSFTQVHFSSFQILLESALPMYITYKLVKMATECLVNEIAGRQSPSMVDLVGGLSEVFCLTDPNQYDNPIIYASEEFYRLTGYGRDDVIGRNCRFLQGANTQRGSVTRLRENIKNGKQACETFLNYRRDGRPFINLLMIAPLHDDKGNVKYHIGAQVDVTGLVEKGKGLDAFDRYLVMKEIDRRDKEINGSSIQVNQQRGRKAKTLAKLRDLSQMFDLEESAVVRSHSRSSSLTPDDGERSIGSSRRVILGESDSTPENGGKSEEKNEDKTWQLGQSGQSGLSGTLPGVYDSYMLIRATSSLRIVFVSPKLRHKFGDVVQHPFLSHIAAPSNTLAGLRESFGTGVAVSAKVNFMLNHGEKRDGTEIRQGSRPDNARACWISATPLLGSDDNIGVWMIVFVDKSKVSTTTAVQKEVKPFADEPLVPSRKDRPTKIDIPVRRSSQRLRQSHAAQGSKLELLAGDVPIKPKRLEEVTESLNSAESTLRAGTDDDKLSIGTKEKEEKETDDQNGGIGAKVGVKDVKDESVPPTDLSFPISEANRKPSEDQFVRPKLNPKISQKSERIHIRADSDAEPRALSTADLDNALVRSLPGSRTGTGTAMHRFGSPPLSPATLNMFNGFSDDGEATPRRADRLDLPNEKSPPTPPQHKSSGVDSPSGKPNGKHYMDYLRHPGTARSSSEYNRVLSGSVLVNSMYHVDEDGKHWAADDVDDFPDRECLGSPYSVD